MGPYFGGGGGPFAPDNGVGRGSHRVGCFLKRQFSGYFPGSQSFGPQRFFGKNKKKKEKKGAFENKMGRTFPNLQNNKLNKRKVMGGPWLAKRKSGSHPPWEGPPRQRSSPLYPTSGWTRGLLQKLEAQGFLGLCPGTLGLLLLDPLKDRAQSQSVRRAPV